MKRIKLLVFTDDCQLVSFLERHLDKGIYEVAFSPASHEKLDKAIYSENPEIVIIDIIVPGLDGIGLSLHVRKISEVPILMLSTWGAGINRIRKLDLSSECYLSEPLTAEELIIMIDQIQQREVIIITPPSASP